MTTKHFVYDSESRTMSKVKGGREFAADGDKVLAVVISGDETHLLRLEGGSYDIGDGGVLKILAGRPNPVRVYGTWSYVEWAPYKTPSAPQVHLM